MKRSMNLGKILNEKGRKREAKRGGGDGGWLKGTFAWLL